MTAKFYPAFLFPLGNICPRSIDAGGGGHKKRSLLLDLVKKKKNSVEGRPTVSLPVRDGIYIELKLLRPAENIIHFKLENFLVD